MTRAFVLVTFAWLAGLAATVVLGLLLGVLVPGPAATIGGPLALGLVIALAQRRAIGRETVGRGFVAITAAGAAVGWLLGSFVSFQLFTSGHEAIAPWTNGLVVGALVGALQSTRIRGLAIRGSSHRTRAAWTAANVIAWGAALGPLLASGTPPYVRIAALAAPGVLTAAAVFAKRKTGRSARELGRAPSNEPANGGLRHAALATAYEVR